MEGGRFDRFSQSVASAMSRRSVTGAIAALAAGVLSAGAGLNAPSPAGAKAKKKECSSGKQCPDPANECLRAVCQKHTCKRKKQPNGTECGDGGQCRVGNCVCPRGVCTVTVRPSRLQGWTFYNDQADQPIDPSFEIGPESPPLGVGSAQLLVEDSTQGKLLAANILTGTPLSALATLEYSFYVTNATSDTGPSLQLGIDFDLTDDQEGFQGRMVYVPSATAAVPEGEWITVDVLADNDGGNWFFTRQASSGGKCPLSDPCNFSEILADFPNIGIHPVGPQGTGAGFGFIGFKVGSGEGAVDANVDSLRLKLDGTGQNTFVYNFEPDLRR
ncbi:MAG: hypothetical protein U0031_12340 [Thermomicrobiales bacterium]